MPGMFLSPEEKQWLEKQLSRSSNDNAGVTPADETDPPPPWGHEMDWLFGLRWRGHVCGEDREALVRYLRAARLNLEMSLTAEEREAELAFINAFLRRLSQADWPEEPPYNAMKRYGSFRISQLEMTAALLAAGVEATYWVAFAALQNGYVLDLGVPGQPKPLRIRMVRTHVIQPLVSVKVPACLMFEADVLEPHNIGGLFGFIYPDGRARVVLSSPDSEFTADSIERGISLLTSDENP